MKIIFEQIESGQLPQSIPIQSLQDEVTPNRSEILQLHNLTRIHVIADRPKSRSEWTDFDDSANQHWGINE